MHTTSTRTPGAAARSPARGPTLRAAPRGGDSLHHLRRAMGNQAVQRAARDPGAPLPGGLRSSLEGYLDTSLGGVRVHDGAASQHAARGLAARAYTLGQDIHLGPEGVRATGAERAALLAHEVVHTVQQGPATVRAKPRVGAPGDAFERQADRLAQGLARYQRDPGDPAARALRGSGGIQRVAGGEPVIQRSRVATHYGEFEDYRYQDMTDAAGNQVGVEMYLRFHPGANAVADLIGMTQAAQGKFNGTQITSGLYGEHSATRGAGVGVFIDQLEGNPNPLYATDRTLVAGGSASNLADYQTTPITALTAAQQTAQAAATGITGRRYNGYGQHGFRRSVMGAFISSPAELYDAPVVPGAGPNSEQTFETTAFAITGSQQNTYYGSVEWGWRKDAAGAFSRLPLRVISRGVPSAAFLTAASIWNPSKASFGLVATAATDLLDNSLTRIAGVPANAELRPTGRSGAVGGNTYIEVRHGGVTGVVISTAVRPAAIGAATVDLPVPMIHTVSNPLGTSMMLSQSLPSNTLTLPAGTRVRTMACMIPTPTLPNHYEAEVADGPHTGTHGYVAVPDLTLEALGTH